MDSVFLAVAFLLGLAARRVGLPPLVGFLATGFALKAAGFQAGPFLIQIAELGVTLLLFSIGLKLKVGTLLRPEVWAGASLHMAATVVVFGLLIFALAAGGAHLFAGLDLATSTLVAFAFSFSSTVFAIKVFEEKGEIRALHARVAIGILIIQDIIAVIFITASTGKLPSPWAFALFGLILLRPLLFRILDRCAHGELVPLFGLFAALVLGAEAFTLVGMKADLGALILGVLLATHPRAGEVSDSLLNFKDILLVGFFVTIGLEGALSVGTVLVALLFIAVLPFKAALFFVVLTRFRLRARSAFLAALGLATYSEFGLIVGDIGVKAGWMNAEWLTAVALALAISFVLGSPLNLFAHSLCNRWLDRLERWETKTRHPDDVPIRLGDARIAVQGMGPVGTAAFDALRERFGDIVVGLDSDLDRAHEHREAGRNVVHGDATDPDFWERAETGRIELVLLTMPKLSANLDALEQAAAQSHDWMIAALARYPDEVEPLKAAGADLAVDIFKETGVGMVAHIERHFAAELAALERADSRRG